MGKGDSVYLIDVVSLDIGICVDRSTFEPILDMESAIPATQTKTFTTGYDNQTQVKIKVAQGTRYEYDKNQQLGEFQLTLAEPKPKGVPQIDVTVSINKEREISVKAVDKLTGKEEKIVFVKQDHELSDARREEMLKDREFNKAADEKLREKDSKIKELENYKDLVNTTVQGAKIDESVRTGVYKQITKIEDFLKDVRNPMSGISAEDVSLRKKEFEREVAPVMGMKVDDKAAPGEGKMPEGMPEGIKEEL